MAESLWPPLSALDKKPEHYLAFLHFACALIAFAAAGLFGLALNLLLVPQPALFQWSPGALDR